MARCTRQRRRCGFIACLLVSSLASPGRARAHATQQERQPKLQAEIVTDETGRRVAVPAKVRRIVSLAPDLTETIYALGAQDRLVGDTSYCDYPPEAQTKAHVGTPLGPSLEAIVALKPDLILATTSINRRETVAALERLGLSVYATNPHSVEGSLAAIRRLSDLIGTGAQGEALVARLQARLDALHTELGGRARRRVLFVVWEDPLISIGQNTFIDDALRWAGAESVVRTKQDWPKLGFEEVVRLQPEYLVFASSHEDSGGGSLSELRARAAWRDLEAVKQGHVAVISEAIDRPSPRLVDAIEQLARQLHPDAFAGSSETKRDASRLEIAEKSHARSMVNRGFLCTL